MNRTVYSRFAALFSLCLVHMFVLNAFPAKAQAVRLQDLWYQGTLVLEDGETLTGELQYNLQNNVVQINLNSSVKAYSARQLFSFQVHDPDLMQERIFYALPYNVEANYKAPILFELLAEGDVSLLAREKLVTENIPQYDYWTGNNYYYIRNRIGHDFYFGYADGKIVRYDGSKRDFFHWIKDRSEQMKGFVSQNRLRYDSKQDLIEMIDYYNSLKSAAK